MVNVDTKINGDKLIITIDLSKKHGLSKSGKTTIIATSGGNLEVKPKVYMGLNVYTKD